MLFALEAVALWPEVRVEIVVGVACTHRWASHEGVVHVELGPIGSFC
jgi:Zn ribbon nucleic-acid-binding protein